MNISIGILGATGYTGAELIRLLHSYPGARITYCSSNRYNGKKLSHVLGFLRGYTDIVLEEFDPEKIAARCDIVFCCLPHGVSMKFIPRIIDKVKVVDLGADFRLHDISVYEEWYQEHTCPELASEAVYGLCDVYADDIRGARLVANPGCYPTSILLPLIPLIRRSLVSTSRIIADSKSGVSGAGRGLNLGSHICEAGESFSAYKPGRSHRHIPEIEQELSVAADRKVNIDFTPHLIPVSRGMLSTIYAGTGAKESELKDCLMTFYEKSPFVHVLEEGLPATKDVRGTNRCIIGLATNKVTGMAVIVSVIDNLTKGASGQALQNMNLMLGFDQATGLDLIPLFP